MSITSDEKRKQRVAARPPVKSRSVFVRNNILCEIGRSVNAHGCSPSLRQLADKLGLSYNRLLRHIKRLEHEGYLYRVLNAYGSVNAHNGSLRLTETGEAGYTGNQKP